MRLEADGPPKVSYFCRPEHFYMADEKGPNFLEEIIDADLKSGRYSSIATRFPPEPNGYLHLGHAKDRAVEKNIFAACKFGMKACSYLK